MGRRWRTGIVLMASLAVVVGACGGPKPLDRAPAVPTVADLAYADSSSAQRLDLWLPPDADGPVPLVIHVHGGAFMIGDKAMEAWQVQPFLDAGYALASVNYRLAEEAPFPAAVQDVKAAVRWLRANAAEHGLDPDRFAAWGESAGGNLVAILGTTGDQRTALDDPALGNGEVSSAVQAVVDWYGPTDFGLLADHADDPRVECRDEPPAEDAVDWPLAVYVGGPFEEVPDVVAAANPVTYVASAGTLPAFSIAHGTADCTVPFPQSELLVDALEEAGAELDVNLVDGARHVDLRIDRDLREPTIDWLDEVLG